MKMCTVFNTELAVRYGVVESIIITRFADYILYHKRNERNFYDGRYWNYCSLSALKNTFPFLGLKQIRYAIEKLKEAGILFTGNYNTKPFDRTVWYALSDEILQIFDTNNKVELSGNESDLELCQNGQMDMPKQANGYAHNDKSEVPVLANEICPKWHNNTNTKYIVNNSSIESASKARTKARPKNKESKKEKSYKQLTEQEFYEELKLFTTKYPKTMLRDFYDHWREKTPSGLMLFQTQKSWQTDLRLKKWQRNEVKWSQNLTYKQNTLLQQADSDGLITELLPNGQTVKWRSHPRTIN